MFNLLVLALGVLNIVMFVCGSHSPLNLFAGLFAIIVFVATSHR